jgi:hypothetical protein
MDSILKTRIREDARHGSNLEDSRRKGGVQTAVNAINTKKKRYTAGLHASAGQFALGPDVLRSIQEHRQQQNAKASEQQGRQLRVFKSLQNKVTLIEEQGKSDEEATQCDTPVENHGHVVEAIK